MGMRRHTEASEKQIPSSSTFTKLSYNTHKTTLCHQWINPRTGYGVQKRHNITVNGSASACAMRTDWQQLPPTDYRVRLFLCAVVLSIVMRNIDIGEKREERIEVLEMQCHSTSPTWNTGPMIIRRMPTWFGCVTTELDRSYGIQTSTIMSDILVTDTMARSRRKPLGLPDDYYSQWWWWWW